MSLFSGGVISGNQLVLDDHFIPLGNRVHSEVKDGQAVTLGMRQEAVSISSGDPPRDGIYLRAQVESSEPDYAHRTQTVHLRTGAWTYAALAPLEERFRVGQTVHALLDPDRLYFFDAASGLRL